MIPDGDRRHHAQSGRVVDQPKSAGISDQDVMAEFVLSHHAGGRKRRVVRRQPVDGMLDRAVSRQGAAIRTKSSRARPPRFSMGNGVTKGRSAFPANSVHLLTKQLSASDRLERIANVLDLGRAAIIGPHDRDHVEAGPLFEQVSPAEKVDRRQGQPSLLLGRDSFGRRAERLVFTSMNTSTSPSRATRSISPQSVP